MRCSLAGRGSLEFGVGKGAVQILVLDDELPAFLHVFSGEEVHQFLLQIGEDVLNAFLDGEGVLGSGGLDFFLDLEDIHHELAVLHLHVLLYVYSAQSHQIDCTLQVVQQSRLGLVDVR
jgi:hypothetical protein